MFFPKRHVLHACKSIRFPQISCLTQFFFPAFILFALIAVFGLPDSAFSQDVTVKKNSETTQTASGQDLNTTETELAGILAPAERANSIEHWEQEIAKLGRLDESEPDPENAVLLLGSSSIRLWENAAEMLAPYPIIRRGYGGARYSDLVVFAKRLITPHEFRALVVFVANDITGSKEDRSVEAVRKMVLHVIEIAREHQPEAPILLVEVTPTPSRFHVWKEIRALNAMLREVALTQPYVSFVTTAEYYLDNEDQPRAELFRDDRLHQNKAGYKVWAELIRRELDNVLSDHALGE
jgi:hypothetical protein